MSVLILLETHSLQRLIFERGLFLSVLIYARVRYTIFGLFSGLECLPAVNLPSGCFCTSGPSPTPYLPLTDLLALIAKKGVNHTKVSVETHEFTTWHVKADNIDLSATFINDLNKSLDGLAPFSISVVHNGNPTIKLSENI